ADFTRSLLSFTAPSGSPTVANWGSPWAMSTSTSTWMASMPTRALLKTFASIGYPRERRPVTSDQPFTFNLLPSVFSLAFHHIQIPLRIQRRHAAAPRGSDCLTVEGVLNISRGKHPVDAGC